MVIDGYFVALLVFLGIALYFWRGLLIVAVIVFAFHYFVSNHTDARDPMGLTMPFAVFTMIAVAMVLKPKKKKL